MLRGALLLTAFLTLALVGGALATHSVSQCEQSVTTIGAGPAFLYIVESDGKGWGQEGTWIYQEANGHPDVQRGGNGWWGFGTGDGGVDWCWDREIATGDEIANPDRILF